MLSVFLFGLKVLAIWSAVAIIFGPFVGLFLRQGSSFGTSSADMEPDPLIDMKESA